MLMMRPASLARSSSVAAARVVKNAPLRFTASVFIHWSSVNRMIRPLIAMPALLTRMSSCLCSAPIALIASVTDVLFATSKPDTAPWPPAASTSAATLRASCSRVEPFASGRKLMTTFAPRRPSATAIARPMPCDAPVTSATLPANALSMIAMTRSLRGKRVDFVRLADRRHIDRLCDPLHETLEHRARAKLVRLRDAHLRDRLNRLFPANGRGHLLDQQILDLLWIRRRLRGHVRHHRHARRCN